MKDFRYKEPELIEIKFTQPEKMSFSNKITSITMWALSAIFSGGLIWALIIGKGSISWLLF